tara:strand:+ start:334 stop:690 length:357 start_codon:yes stop_codon:yes gene_type:complete
MKKLLYFSSGLGADATGETAAVAAEDICSIVPLTVTSTLMYYKGHGNTINAVKFGHDDTSTTTGHRVKDISKAIAHAANAGPHINGIVDVVDFDNSIFFNGLSFITACTMLLETSIDF